MASTLAKAQNLLVYVPDSTIGALAVAYGYGHSQNHVFVYGHKCVGLASMAAFVFLNGYEITSTEAEEVSIVLSAAIGRCSQEELALWVQRSIVMISRSL